jgi:hypothetical protein
MGRKSEAGRLAMQKSRLYWMMWGSIFRWIFVIGGEGWDF